MSRTTLVVNCGSSSIKHRLYDEDERELCRGAVEGVGAASGVAWLRVAGGEKQRQEAAIPDHGDGLRLVCDALDAAAVIAGDGPSVVAHRVVHGGARFTAPAVVDDAVLAELDRLTPLAPLHNPANVLGVRLASERFPRATHVAVFDTAFHATAPDHATRYAVPKRLAIEHGVRRYGFHGASHAWASRRAAELLGRPVRELRTVVLHLGAGASACAVDCGRSIDTSMGMTPLEGLVMATRSGDLDPGVVLFLQRELGLSSDEVDRLLNRESGLTGLAGDGDMRRLLERSASGDADATLAIDAYVYRIAKQVGAYAAAMGALDAVVFTAGVGEHSAAIRAMVAERLGLFRARVDAAANADGPSDRAVHAADSGVALLVVEANEERQIARDALGVMGGQ